MDLVFRHQGTLYQASEFIELANTHVGALSYSPQSGIAFFISQDLIGNWVVRALSDEEWAKLRPQYSVKVRASQQNVVKQAARGILPIGHAASPRPYRHPAHHK
jgi:hypothetical protein